MIGPTTPEINFRFGLFPLRSPLLWESLIDFFSSAYWDVSLQQVSLSHPMYSDENNGSLLPLGSPIRISPDHSFFPAPRSFSQVSTSFFAYRYQGIHQQPLVAWIKNFKTLLIKLSIALRQQRYFAYAIPNTYISQICMKSFFSSANFHQWLKVVSDQSQ